MYPIWNYVKYWKIYVWADKNLQDVKSVIDVLTD